MGNLASDLEKGRLRPGFSVPCSSVPLTSCASVSLFRSESNCSHRVILGIKCLVTKHSIFFSKWSQDVDCVHYTSALASGWACRSDLQVSLPYLLPSLVENGRGFDGDGRAGPPCPGLLCGGHPLSWLPGRKLLLLILERPCSSPVPSVSMEGKK